MARTSTPRTSAPAPRARSSRPPRVRRVTASAEVDALFKLPLGEFTPARNALAAQLKKAGRKAEADEAKALEKPSVSAWAVNQLYWRHRGLFDRLVAAGDRMRRAQAAHMTGDAAREPANARREVLTALTKIAEGLLLGGDYGATRDMLRRVTTTLEALSSYGSLPDAPPAGRLTDDVEPPGFEALAGLPMAGKKRQARAPEAHTRSRPAALPTKPARAKESGAAARRAEAERKSQLAAAKAAMRDAERALKVARKQAERAAAQLDAAATRAKVLEAERAQIEKRLAGAAKDAEAARRDAAEAVAKSNDASAAVTSAESAVELARRRLSL